MTNPEAKIVVTCWESGADFDKLRQELIARYPLLLSETMGDGHFLVWIFSLRIDANRTPGEIIKSMNEGYEDKLFAEPSTADGKVRSQR